MRAGRDGLWQRDWQMAGLGDLAPPIVTVGDFPTHVHPAAEVYRARGVQALIDRFDAGAGRDRRAVASMWSRYHFAALTRVWILADVLPGLVFDTRAHCLGFEFSEAGLTHRLWLRPDAAGSASSGDAAGLVAHVRPLCEVLRTLSGLSMRVFWSNLAVYVEHCVGVAAAHPGHDAARLARWKKVLWLEHDAAGVDANPLLRPLVAGTCGERVRRRCCMCYLEEQWSFCSHCPISSERAARTAARSHQENPS